MWMQYPKLPEFYSVDDQYLIGSDLLVKPVTSPGVIKSMIHFPSSESWYDVDTMKRVKSATTQSKDNRTLMCLPRRRQLRAQSAPPKSLQTTDPRSSITADTYPSPIHGKTHIRGQRAYSNYPLRATLGRNKPTARAN